MEESHDYLSSFMDLLEPCTLKSHYGFASALLRYSETSERLSAIYPDLEVIQLLPRIKVYVLSSLRRCQVPMFQFQDLVQEYNCPHPCCCCNMGYKKNR